MIKGGYKGITMDFNLHCITDVKKDEITQNTQYLTQHTMKKIEDNPLESSILDE